VTTLFPFDNSQDRDEANEAPEAMINLEVWIPQGYNLLQEVDSRNLEDCGALGPTGRYFHFLRHSFVMDNVARFHSSHFPTRPSATSATLLLLLLAFPFIAFFPE
jgi:hypothetical protein